MNLIYIFLNSIIVRFCIYGYLHPFVVWRLCGVCYPVGECVVLFGRVALPKVFKYGAFINLDFYQLCSASSTLKFWGETFLRNVS
jgi:hypothetical protein